MPELSQIAAVLPEAVLVAEMNRRAAALDEYAALKLDVNDPALAADRAILAALREEWRKRSGEII